MEEMDYVSSSPVGGGSGASRSTTWMPLLADDISSAEYAAPQMNELNQIYGVDVSTYTLLTQTLHANSGQEVLVDRLAQSTPGEEAVLFNQVPDGNGGQPLPANPLFGELVAGTSIINPPLSARVTTTKPTVAVTETAQTMVTDSTDIAPGI